MRLPVQQRQQYELHSAQLLLSFLSEPNRTCFNTFFEALSISINGIVHTQTTQDFHLQIAISSKNTSRRNHVSLGVGHSQAVLWGGQFSCIARRMCWLPILCHSCGWSHVLGPLPTMRGGQTTTSRFLWLVCNGGGPCSVQQ